MEKSTMRLVDVLCAIHDAFNAAKIKCDTQSAILARTRKECPDNPSYIRHQEDQMLRYKSEYEVLEKLFNQAQEICSEKR